MSSAQPCHFQCWHGHWHDSWIDDLQLSYWLQWFEKSHHNQRQCNHKMLDGRQNRRFECTYDGLPGVGITVSNLCKWSQFENSVDWIWRFPQKLWLAIDSREMNLLTNENGTVRCVAMNDKRRTDSGQRQYCRTTCFLYGIGRQSCWQCRKQVQFFV